MSVAWRQLPAGSMLSAQGLLSGAALAILGTGVRTRAYVDGFNLYYGALKGSPFKWLDPVRLASLLLLRECEIDRLRYFTARVSGKLDPQAPVRQRIYIRRRDASKHLRERHWIKQWSEKR